MAGAGGGGAAAGRPPRCSYHPALPATAMCISCGRPVCAYCDCFLGLRHYCPQCVPAVAPVVPHPFPPPPPPRRAPEAEDEGERRWARADWGLPEVFVAGLMVFGLYSVAGLILVIFTDTPHFFNHLAYALIFCPLVALSAWVILRHRGRGREELGLRWGETPRTLAFGGLGALAGLGMSYGIYFSIYLIFYLAAGRGPVSPQSERLRDLSGGHLALVLTVVVVLAPLFEELFFRGLFYPALRRRLAPSSAIVLNGAIFGIMHFQPLFMLSLVLVGIAFAWLYEKTGSLAAPIIAHALYNLVVTAVSLLAGW